MLQINYLFLLTTSFAAVYSASFVTKCKSDDSKCAKEAAVNLIPKFSAGIPEFGTKPLDPLFIAKTNASSPHLKLVVTDYTVTGLKDCVPKKVKYDKSKSKIFFKLMCSSQLEGNYEMKGKLLFLPLEGKGPLHVKLNKAEINVEIDLNDIEKDGVSYWNIKNWKHTFELKERCTVVFDNLFDGNEVLATAAKEVISVSGNEIIEEVGFPVFTDVVKIVVDTINEMFHQVPASELSY